MNTSQRVARQRMWAKLHLIFASVRFVSWTTLGAMYVAGAGFTSSLFRTVAFVAMCSVYANALTDLSIAMGAYAALIAADAREDVHGASERILKQILSTVEAIEDRELN